MFDHDVCYKAIKSQDARFDGVFFTTVKTTGIYCRPVCKVPAPKIENCHFVATAAEAESQGYRPCLRCRPELSPEYSEFKQSHELLNSALVFLEHSGYKPGSIKTCSEHLGITTRHLNRLFNEQMTVSPQAYVMTKRLLRSKALLTDTNLTILEISNIVGFGSVSRFNAAFKTHYKMTPTALRQKNNNSKKKDVIVIKLAYRPPYNWDMMLDFFSMRTIPGVESVQDGCYRRSLMLLSPELISGWIEVKPIPNENRVQLSVSRSLEKGLLDVITIVKKAFDLDASPSLLPESLPKGIRLPGCFDAFEMATRAILGQQITVKAARTLTRRLVEALGEKMESPWKEIEYHFPLALAISKLETSIESVLGPLGIIKTRSRSILALARNIANHNILLKSGVSVDQEKSKLLSLKGIGPWTAEYLVMRGISWPDAFPVSDVGVKHALAPLLKDSEGKPLFDNTQNLSKYQLNKLYEKEALRYAEQFKPWRSYLTISLWYKLGQ